MTRPARVLRFGLFVLAALALVPTAVARAADPPAPRVTLTWVAPAACPQGPRVVAEVERLLGAAPPPEGGPLVATATVTEDPSGELHVRVEARGGVRELHAASCDALADATATILALMIDPTAVTLAPAVPPPVAPPVVLPPPPPATPPPLPPVTDASPRRPSFRAAAWAVADIGSLPGAGLGVGATLQIVSPVPAGLRFELGGVFLPNRGVSLARPVGAGGDIRLGLGFAAACYDLLSNPAFELSPCLAYEIGQLHGAGTGVTDPSSGNQLWSALRPGIVAAWAPIKLLAVVLRVEVAVPFDRETFTLQNVGPVFQPSAAAGRLGLGLELRP